MVFVCSLFAKAILFNFHAYSNILKILPLTIKNFQIIIFFIFFIYLLKTGIVGTIWNHLDKEVLTSTQIYAFEQKYENNAYPCKPQLFYIKVGFKGVKIIYACSLDGSP